MTAPAGPLNRSLLAVTAAALAACVGVAQADDPAGVVSRSPDGRVLHRLIPSEDGPKGAEDTRRGVAGTGQRSPRGGGDTRSGPGAAPPTTRPTFIYDPRRGARDAAKDAPPPSPTPGEAAPRAAEPTAAEARQPTSPPDNPVDALPPATEARGDEPSDVEPPDGPTSSPDTAEATDERRIRLGDRVRPDTDTERERDLHYHALFDPSVVPHKRARALNAVDARFDLHLERGALRPAETDLAALGGRPFDRFTAEAVVEAEAGEPLPLPSVSPHDVIVGWEIAPAQAVTFSRDDADNLYATMARSGRAQLTWRLATPRAYFSRSVRAPLAPSAIPAALRPRPPALVRAQAREVARAIGLDLRADLGTLLEGLVLYFRAFEPGEPPPRRAGIYRDLALGQVGVCRHRAHAFVVTALGLGLPARYLYNEAHVFVEVWLPAGDDGSPAGWLRVDLGGGADTLDVHGGQQRTLHRPPADPFPYPPGFDPDSPAGATAVRGLPAPQPEEAPPTEADPEGAAGLDAPDRRAGPDRPSPSRPDPDGSFRWPATALWLPAGDLPAPTRQVPETRRRQPATITFEVGRDALIRGAPFTVSGAVRGDDGNPARDGAIQLLISPAGSAGATTEPPWILGAAHVDGEGRFRIRATVPLSLPPGDYELVTEFLGNASLAPAIGR